MHFIFSPEVVLCKRYGTCSAKATLTFALLQFVRLYGEDARVRSYEDEGAKLQRCDGEARSYKGESAKANVNIENVNI